MLISHGTNKNLDFFVAVSKPILKRDCIFAYKEKQHSYNNISHVFEENINLSKAIVMTWLLC